MNTDRHLLLDAFAARLRRLGLADGTVQKYRQGTAHFFNWLGDRDIRYADVEAYLDDINASPATTRARIAALRRFYLFLDSRNGLVDDDGRELRSPVDRVERPRSQQRPNDWLRPEEDAAFQAAVLDPREEAVVALMRWAGLRVGEACALRWSDVGDDFVRIRGGKTASARRRVPVLPELASALARWRAYLEHRGLYRPDGPVLATSRGSSMKPQFAWRVVKRVAARADVRAREATDRSGYNVSAVTDHTLRRTFATDLINRGVRIETVARALGHADTRTTMAHYAELQDETLAEEVLAAYA